MPTYLLAIVLGAVVIPALAWRFVGPLRHRDPFLLPLFVVALAFTIGGMVGWVEAPFQLDWYLMVGAAGLLIFAQRWRTARQHHLRAPQHAERS